MNRREMIGWSSLATMAAVSGVAGSAETAAGESHDAHAHPPEHAHHEVAAKYAALARTSSECLVAGDACLSHCLAVLEQGEKGMAQCARTVRDTLAACTALRELAAANSPHTRDLARVVSAICADCDAECRKHPQHQVCQDCGKACRDCKSECDKAMAA